jgi:hypothetical protein
MQCYIFVCIIVYITKNSAKRYLGNPSEPLAGNDQAIETADVTRPPSHRAEVAGGLIGDVSVKQAVRNTRNGIPSSNSVDGLIGDTSKQRD